MTGLPVPSPLVYTFPVRGKLPESPATVNPSRPYSDPIEWIHRGNDGWVPFARLDEHGKFQHLYSAPAAKIPGLFDSLADDLERDSYFGLHSMMHAGARDNPHHPTLPRAMRRADKVKYLNVAWVDLDFYTLGMELHEVIAGVIYQQQRGIIPPASFFADSGRGLWVFWKLYDPETGHGPRAWPDKKVLWAKIQGEMYRRMLDFGADKQARDLARVSRVPGSLNTKVSRRVAYWVQADATGRPFMYTLAGLKEALGVTPDTPTPLELKVHESAALPAPAKPTPPEWDGKEKTKWGARRGDKRTEHARKAHSFRWIHALNDFRTLRAIRGAFQKGTRHDAAWVFAMILWRNRLPYEEVYREVEQLGRECIPEGLTDAEIMNAVKQAHKYQKIHNGEIADRLLITPEESEMLARWPPMGAPRPAPRVPVRQGAREKRREAIERYLYSLPWVPKLREIQDQLENEGIDTTIDTINRDLAALGVKNPRRKKKDATLSLFPC